jgi:hypothetical protein
MQFDIRDGFAQVEFVLGCVLVSSSLDILQRVAKHEVKTPILNHVKNLMFGFGVVTWTDVFGVH